MKIVADPKTVYDRLHEHATTRRAAQVSRGRRLATSDTDDDALTWPIVRADVRIA